MASAQEVVPAATMEEKMMDMNQTVSRVVGSIKNSARYPLTLNYAYNYERQGQYKVRPPLSIAMGQSGGFEHKGFTEGTNHGSKSVVVYSEYKMGATGLRSYLVAWDVPISANNKVYVETGPVGKFANPDYAAIARKLSASGSTSEYLDPVTRAHEKASIGGTGYDVKLQAEYN